MTGILSANRPDLRWVVAYLGLLSQLVVATWSPALTAAAGADAVLVMDSSGSMAKNDPKRMRVPAAKMFMKLLGSEDRVALISFSDHAYPVLHLTTPSAETSARILASADSVSSKGIYTNLYAAVAKGLDMLGEENKLDQDKMLVLMSDGKMDVGDSNEDRLLTEKLQAELLENAKSAGIRVYTIAFTEDSDTELLGQVANETGALFKVARSDNDLHEVFGAIFESAKHPDMLPIEGNEFLVDKLVEELTIIASKQDQGVRIYLQSPSGEKLEAENASSELKWFQSHLFDMITLSKPAPGAWKLLSTGGSNRVYIVTNMALNHSNLQRRLMVGENMVLESWLEQDGNLLDKEAVLTNTRFLMEIRNPNGETTRLDLSDRGEHGDKKPADGVYATTLTFAHAGSYQVELIAESETFQRQKMLHVQVEPPPPAQAQAEPEEAPEPEVESLQKLPQQERLEPEPGPEPASEPKSAKVIAEEEENPAPAAVEDTARDVEPEKHQGTSLVLVAAVFTGFNLLLGGIVFLVWWFFFKRKSSTIVTDQEQVE